MKFSKYFIFLAIFLLFCPSLMADEEHELRVSLVGKGVSSFSIEVNKPYKITNPNTGETLKEGRKLKKDRVHGTKFGIKIGDQLFRTDLIRVVCKSQGATKINDLAYRGEFSIRLLAGRKVLVINHVGLEDYMRGVLAGEMPKRWPDNALRAQAIASRTYALYQKGIMRERPYDLYSDIYSQVYGGISNESRKTDEIVRETKGVVMVFDNTLFPAYFSSCCGGKTEFADVLWDIDLPCLRSVKCGYCQDSPNYKWTFNLKDEQIIAVLEKKFGQSGEDIRGLKIIEKTRSGRVKKIGIKMDKRNFTMEAKDFRILVGPRLIKSTMFKCKQAGDKVVFNGRGWGHGVGMCQWGAKGLALNNYRADEILQYYYPNSSLVRVE